jgi:hypothetical protein
MRLTDIKNEVDLLVWVKQHSHEPIQKEYEATVMGMKLTLALKYPSRPLPEPKIQPAHTRELGGVRFMVCHYYEFPDGFKAGCMLVLGQGAQQSEIVNVVLMEPANFLRSVDPSEKPQ